MDYISTIGLEIHAELKTKTKMFCACKNETEKEVSPNVNVCPICMGHPGTLPVANEEAMKKIIKVGIALGSKIPDQAFFYRKNYFYPDLPKGYQITSQEAPFAIGGQIQVGDKSIRVNHVHLEEDTGKLQHSKESDFSLVDYNRAGVPLMELVTEADISSGIEAKEFCQKLRLILRYLDVSDAGMEKGQMRCEVNVSISKTGKLGTKVEVKNLNSFKAVERAIDYEIKRQKEVLGDDKKVIQETRGWDEAKGKTTSQRKKEDAHDYRYLKDPDLPIIDIKNNFDLENIKAGIIELPEQREVRYKEEYDLKKENISVLVQNKGLGDYFEYVASELNAWLNASESCSASSTSQGESNQKAIKLASNYIVSELQKMLVAEKMQIEKCKITPENFAELIKMIIKKEVSSSGAQELLKEMFETGGDPSQIVEAKDLKQISGGGEIEKFIDEAIKNNPKSVEDYKKGKENALQFLVGQTMKASKGKANPGEVGEILKNRLTE
ncbi:Asp-tRNA(Asn)/Glu-tRNA(Gln) amidotransferase subunit GatB [bacterium]|nr:MAG: Asp-tRNA(Asn)/Glu-tRNA(Gln) amidotransferase subunit GatB [bacterium]